MTEHRVCTRCIMDTTAPDITFDENGVCSYCHLHDRLEQQYPLTPAGERRFMDLVERIKKDGRGKEFDVVSGLSGGRDSTYTLLLAKKLGLRPLAVYFNDGFGNPVAGKNMQSTVKKLGVEMRTITADWRESKDLKLSALKASIPELNLATDIGIATALYGQAAAEDVKYVFIGQSFRTEGISPLAWHYLDGRYLHAVHKQFGTFPLKKWTPNEPGFHLDFPQLIYYTMYRRIRTIMPLYHLPYVRKDVDKILSEELGWTNTGAHYFDDLFQALLNYVLRVKFNVDRRKFNYGALVRSGQMTRTEALEKIQEVYVLEDEKIINLCIKRMGITRDEFDEMLAQPPKVFWDYPNLLSLMRKFKPAIWALAKARVIPFSSYEKYCRMG